MVKLLSKFIKERSQLHNWLFCGFLLTSTLSIRKVLFFYPLGGQFDEYSGIYLYLSDIFLIVTLLVWGYSILYHKKLISSSKAVSLTTLFKGTPHLFRSMFHVEQSYRSEAIIWAPLLFVIWSFVSLIWAENKFVALFKSVKLIELGLLYLYIIYNVPRGTFFKNLFRIIIALSVVQSLIAVYQFILQHSIGLNWLRESVIGPDISGVAKLIFDGHKIIRAYGLFPHPNILGGFLLLSIILTWSYHKLFHVEQFGHDSITSKTKAILIIQLIGLVLTFSKSAILGLAIAALYIALKNNVPRGTFSLKALLIMFHVEHFSRKLILSLGIILSLAFVVRPDINSVLFKSLNERLFYLNVSRGTILANPVIGVGAGQSVLEMNKYVPRLPVRSLFHVEQTKEGGTSIESWQYQPVHNVFLLIWSELGIIGLLIFIWWQWELFHVEQKIAKLGIKCSNQGNTGCEVYEPIKQVNVPRGTFLAQQQLLRILKGALLGLIFIMLFDHYLWDIQQGQILFWLIAGLIGGHCNAERSRIDKM